MPIMQGADLHGMQSGGLLSAHRSPWRLTALIAVSLLVVCAGGMVQLGAGSYDMSWRQAWEALVDPHLWEHPSRILRLLVGEGMADRLGCERCDTLPTSTLIVWTVRMPRVLVAILVGINLAYSGSILQAVTRNEMADPYLLGVSSGSGLAIAVVFMFLPGLGVHLPLLAMVGGLTAFAVVYAIAWSRGTSPVRLVLAGVIVGAIARSVETAMHYLAQDSSALRDATAWTSGSLIGARWEHVLMVLPWTSVSVIVALCGARYLDILLLGDATAKSLGMSIERVRFLLAATAVLSAASAVAAAGMIGFVGLIVPHMVRGLVGSPHRGLLLGCLVAGPALLIGADAASRLILNPLQLPVGLVTGAIGGAFFLILMRRKRDFGRL